jgi:hypothetical protein
MAACKRRDSAGPRLPAAGRVDAGVMWGLLGVDVADSCHDTLVEQHGLHWGASVPDEAPPERGHRERLAQRLSAEPAKERVGGAWIRAGQADPAEPPGVVVVHAGGLVEPEDGPGGRIRRRLQHAGSRVAPGDPATTMASRICTDMMHRPGSTVARPRRSVSTSGSSGTGQAPSVSRQGHAYLDMPRALQFASRRRSGLRISVSPVRAGAGQGSGSRRPGQPARLP